jgi:hypothetical protein
VTATTSSPFFTSTVAAVKCPPDSNGYVPGTSGTGEGSGCTVEAGYSGDVKATSTSPFYTSTIKHVPCPTDSTGSNVVGGCNVNAGYSGEVIATTSSPFYTSTIKDVPCPTGSTGNVASGCTVDAGYSGGVTANTSSPFYYTSNIQDVPCPTGSTGNVADGCTVNAGYSGAVTATTSSPFYTSTIKGLTCIPFESGFPEGLNIVEISSYTTPIDYTLTDCSPGYSGSFSLSCLNAGDELTVQGSCTPNECFFAPMVGQHGYNLPTSCSNFVHGSIDCAGASCAAGYNGNIDYSCLEQDGQIILGGCYANVCKVPSSPQTGYYNIPEMLTLCTGLVTGSIHCPVTCDDGYHYDPNNDSKEPSDDSATCDNDGDQLTFHGCNPNTCIAPTSAPGISWYALWSYTTPVHLTSGGKCADGYHADDGDGGVFSCDKHGDPLTVTGCSPNVCSDPEEQEGYVLPESCSNTIHGSIACEAGGCAEYYHETDKEKGVTFHCDNHGSNLTMKGCAANVCVLTSSKVGYDLLPGQTVPPQECLGYDIDYGTAACEEGNCSAGYGSSYSAVCEDHQGTPILEGCAALTCVAPSTLPEGYNISTYKSYTTPVDVDGACMDGYYGDVTVSCLSTVSVSSTVSVKSHPPTSSAELTLEGSCLPYTCINPVADQVGYILPTNCTNFTTGSIDCSDASCAKGYHLEGSITYSCLDNGEQITLGGCEPNTCTNPTKEQAEQNGYEAPVCEGRTTGSISCEYLPVCGTFGGFGSLEHWAGSPDINDVSCEKDGDPLTLSGCTRCTSVSNTNNWLECTKLYRECKYYDTTSYCMPSLFFDDNDLSGTIPTEFGDVFDDYAEYLYLQNNQLSGTIPTEMGLLTKLEYLHLHGNRLTGTVPESLCHSQHVKGTHITDCSVEDGTFTNHVECPASDSTCCNCDEGTVIAE